MDERRISPFAEDARGVLRETAGDDDNDGLPKDEALEVIAADEHFGEADAEAALTELESRGHIYFVGETVRITPTDD